MSEAGTALAQRQTVVIYVNASGEITGTEPPVFRISKGNQEEVVWKINNPNFSFTVEFEGESPFYESQFDNEHSASGLVRRSVLGDPKKVYNYKINVAGVDSDPGGIITR